MNVLYSFHTWKSIEENHWYSVLAGTCHMLVVIRGFPQLSEQYEVYILQIASSICLISWLFDCFSVEKFVPVNWHTLFRWGHFWILSENISFCFEVSSDDVGFLYLLILIFRQNKVTSEYALFLYLFILQITENFSHLQASITHLKHEIRWAMFWGKKKRQKIIKYYQPSPSLLIFLISWIMHWNIICN